MGNIVETIEEVKDITVDVIERVEGEIVPDQSKLRRISKGELPPLDKYVLIYCNYVQWPDKDDPLNVPWRVAKRIKMDVDDIHKVPYAFIEFGTGNWLGEFIDIWCSLPSEDDLRYELKL